jgi:pimeloyl-[acyl-carrier protein] synthase
VHMLLAQNQWKRLESDPSQIKTAVEEVVRYISPVQIAIRFVMEPFEYGGYNFQYGDQVYLAVGAANRDPERFPNSHQLDISRSDNPHLAFGSGIHYCLGAPLARIEAEIALTQLRQRFPALSLDSQGAYYYPGLAMRNIKSLWVRA